MPADMYDRFRLWRIALAVSCAIGLSSLASLAAAEALSPADREFLESLEKLENHQGARDKVARQCRASFDGTDGIDDFRLLMVGFLRVPEAQVGRAVCDAMVKAVATRRLKLITIRNAMLSDDESVTASALGEILRAVYFAHGPGRGLTSSPGGKP